ncbi:MAG: hypothetical protein KDA42_04090 [Planctomycetales bacterium]|nr:hypothetical protein [Planctomycetales bacterium]
MPILAAETCVFPTGLLDGNCSGESGRRWWAVYTKARQEKALARYLSSNRVPFYLPLIAKENLIRGRRVVSQIPLFGGYVFLYGDEHERVSCLTTNRVSRILEVPDGLGLLSDLRNVQTLIDSDAPLTVERRLQPGQRVRIKAGSMMGMEGTILSRKGKSRLVVAVQFLQQGISVEINGFMVEPI